MYRTLFFISEKEDFCPLDNGASTPALRYVKEKVDNFLLTYGSIHRGAGFFSEKSTQAFESAREQILRGIHADIHKDCVVFGMNTSDCIARAALIMKPRVVVCSDIEHSANKLPWKRITEEQGGELIELSTKPDGIIRPERLEEILKSRKDVELVALTGASNISGYVTPIKEVHAVCKKYGVPFLLDASQYAPHFHLDMREDADLVAFCGHKMYAPFGSAALVGPKDLLRKPSVMTGGGNVIYATTSSIYYKDAPFIHEAGTPNGQGAVALGAAVEKLSSTWRALEKHTKLLAEKISEISYEIEKVGYEVYFGKKVEGVERRTPVLVIRNKWASQEETVKRLQSLPKPIFCRLGTFCAYQLVENMGLGRPENPLLKDDYNMIKLNDQESVLLDEDARLDHSYDLIRFSAGLINDISDIEYLRDSLIKINREILREKFKKLPVSVNNLFGDPFFGKEQTENTLQRIEELGKSGHTGIISVITKSPISRETADRLMDLILIYNLKLVVLVSISGLGGVLNEKLTSEKGQPVYYEPSKTKDRYQTLAYLQEVGVPCIAYVRPFIPGVNTSEEVLGEIFEKIHETGCKIAVFSGLRGNDEILNSLMDEEEAKKFNFRVKVIPSEVKALLTKFSEKFGLTTFDRTSCGVAYALDLEHSHNPYQAAPQLAGCLKCPLKATCFDQRDSEKFRPTSEDLAIAEFLGYKVKTHLCEKGELCRVKPTERLGCRSCCTSCYQLERNSIELLEPEKLHLGDATFLRLLLGKLVWGKDLHEEGKIESEPTQSWVKQCSEEHPVYVVNSWFCYARSTSKCYHCSYCIISGKYDNAMLGNFGTNPSELGAEIFDAIMKESK